MTCAISPLLNFTPTEDIAGRSIIVAGQSLLSGDDSAVESAFGYVLAAARRRGRSDLAQPVVRRPAATTRNDEAGGPVRVDFRFGFGFAMEGSCVLKLACGQQLGF
jgi:hypothetical protein